MKLQGFSGSGKTNFYLTMFNDMAAGKKPDEVLLCIIDCDLEGQADLIARDSIVDPAIRKRILRKVCTKPDEVNEMVLAFIDLMRQHQEQHPAGVRMIVLENEGAYYLGCRNHYAESVHGMSEAELLSRQQQALREGKKTLPTFEEGQMHSYKVINKLFVQPFERLKMGAELYGAHFISTTLLKSRTEGFGTPTPLKSQFLLVAQTLQTHSLIGLLSSVLSNESRAVNYRFVIWLKSRSQGLVHHLFWRTHHRNASTKRWLGQQIDLNQ